MTQVVVLWSNASCRPANLVGVSVRNSGRPIHTIAREIDIPASDWFYVAVADLSVSCRLRGDVEDIETKVDGQLAS